MEKVSFKQQWWTAFAIVIIGCALSTAFKVGFISNIGWVLSGLLFVIHPVCPEAWKYRYGDDEKRMKRDFRIAGAVVILLGLIIRFGV